jgi:PPM family protein phosphatase
MQKLICEGESSTGVRRTNNEDALLMLPDLGLMAVADGMGGAASGEVASRILAATVRDTFFDVRPVSLKDTRETVRKSLFRANEQILTKARNHAYEGMGCTAEVLAFSEKHYVLVPNCIS